MKSLSVTSRPEIGTVFESAVAEAVDKGGRRIVSVSIDAPGDGLAVDPIDLFAAARAEEGTAVLWQLPSHNVALVGIGWRRGAREGEQRGRNGGNEEA